MKTYQYYKDNLKFKFSNREKMLETGKSDVTSLRKAVNTDTQAPNNSKTKVINENDFKRKLTKQPYLFAEETYFIFEDVVSLT